MRFFTYAAIRRSLVGFGLGLVALLGCYNSGEGADPDDKRPYYPTGIALSASGKWLFLANSNFDLAYNAGTVQAYDVEAIKTAFDACKAGGSDCAPDASSFVRASVRIGAFAADMRAIDVRAADGSAVAGRGRLLIPVRGDASLTTVDFIEGAGQITLKCTTGASPNTFGTRCTDEWRLGTEEKKSWRGVKLEGEPFGLAVPEHWPATGDGEPRRSGGIAAVVHQSSGNVSLFVRTAEDTPIPQGKLAHVLGGLAGGGTGIAALDLVRDGERFVPRFLVTNRSQSNVLVVQYVPDPVIERGGLVLSDIVPIAPQASGFDTRGVVVDPPGPGEIRPTRVFLTNRTPAALVVGEIDPVTRKLSFHENFALPIGPSRITRASIDVGGVSKTLILAASFDARSIVIFDPDSRRISNVIRTFRGPYAMAIDSPRKLAYIANFTDSSIQVLELEPAAAVHRITFSVGPPAGPKR